MERRELFRSRTFARDRRTWFLTVLFGAAAWAGTTAWLNRHVTHAARTAAAPGDDGRFAVLAFDRIVPTADPRRLDRLALRERLRGLARAGFQAVTLREVRDACDGTAPLPAKPILLTFDEGYLSTYEAVDPVLRELRWPAVMFLRTDRQETRDVAFLFWDRLARMVESGLWEIASGDPAGAPPPAAASVPDLPPGSARIAERLRQRQLAAWAPRGWDPVAALGCGDDVRARRAAGRPSSWLGFADDPAGVNRVDGDPYRLARLRVDPGWTTDELVTRLERSLASVPVGRADGGEPIPPASWVAGEGTVEATATGIALTGRPRAAVWIPGSLFADDFVVEATLAPGSGEYWIVQEGDGPGSEWRLGGVGRRVYLESRRPGAPPEVLARRELPEGDVAPHRVRLIRRGAGVVVTWDGAPFTATPLTLPTRHRGKLGVVTYGAGGGTGRLLVSGLRFAAYPYVVRPVPASPSAEDVSRLSREAPAIAALSPPWGVFEAGTLRAGTIDDDLFRILARRYGWDLLATVNLVDARGPEVGERSWAAETATRLRSAGFSGAQVDLTALSAESRTRWAPAVRELDLALARAGGRLVVAEGRPR